MVISTPTAPAAKIQGPCIPKTPSPLDFIQMIAPIARKSAAIDPTTGQGLGSTR